MEKATKYSERVLQYCGIMDLASSFKDESFCRDKVFETDCKKIEDFTKLKEACKAALENYQELDRNCKDKIQQVQLKLTWQGLEKSHYHVFAEVREVDETLSSIVRNKDIELILPINKIEFETILSTCEMEFRKILEQRLEKTLAEMQGPIAILIGKVGDPSLTQKFDDLIDDLGKMKTNVQLRKLPKEVVPMNTWDNRVFMVDAVCTVMMGTGVALEAIPVAGNVAGTALIITAGVMKLTAMIAQQYVKHQAKLQQEQKNDVVETLKNLAQAVKNHCHFLNDSMTLIGTSKDMQSANNKAMSADKQQIMESLTKMQ